MSGNTEKETGGVHDGHRERMRERFRRTGFESMHPHEMLEMLLFYSIPRKDTNEIAHGLIETFGSLAGVFEASEEQLVKVGGISQNSATLIKMIIPLYNEYRRETGNAKRLNNATECGEFLIEYYAGLMKERVTVLCLDGGCRVLGFENVCDGDVSTVMMNCRRLIEIVMKYPLTAAVIIAHNHPGGIALPSRDDVRTTTELHNTLGNMGIHLVDHIIVADNDYVSMSTSSNFKHIFG